MCVCVISLQLACARKSHPNRHHSTDVSIKELLCSWNWKKKKKNWILVPSFVDRLLAVSSQEDCRLFMLLSITGHVSLFPLLFTPFENVLKVVVVLTYSLASYSFLSALHYDPKSKATLLKFRSWERFFLYGLAAVALFESCIYSMVDPSGRLPFLPLMIMSVYCAIGIIYVWLLFVIGSLKIEKKISKQKWTCLFLCNQRWRFQINPIVIFHSNTGEQK